MIPPPGLWFFPLPLVPVHYLGVKGAYNKEGE